MLLLFVLGIGTPVLLSTSGPDLAGWQPGVLVWGTSRWETVRALGLIKCIAEYHQCNSHIY